MLSVTAITIACTRQQAICVWLYVTDCNQSVVIIACSATLRILAQNITLNSLAFATVAMALMIPIAKP